MISPSLTPCGTATLTFRPSFAFARRISPGCDPGGTWRGARLDSTSRQCKFRSILQMLLGLAQAEAADEVVLRVIRPLDAEYKKPFKNCSRDHTLSLMTS